jgi:aspartate racemase
MVPLSKSGGQQCLVGSNPTLSVERCWSGLTGAPGERVSPLATVGSNPTLSANLLKERVIVNKERRITMKTIGLIGGMSWESTAEYYRIINEAVKEKLGGSHSAKIVMYSVDFEQVRKCHLQGNWGEATNLMIDAARKVEQGGADFVLICTNTMHKMAEDVAASITIPLLHIADVTAEKIIPFGFKKLGLLGTTFTMEEEFYKGRLKEKYGLDVIIPGKVERQTLDNIIFNELCLGEIKHSSREQIKTIMKKLIANGAQGIILGCTELPLLVKQEDSPVPLFDTTAIHAEAAVEYALKD